MYLFFVILYMVLVTGAGIFFSRKKRSSEAFLNAEGDLPWIVNAGTLIATYVGSGAVVGGAALAYSSGYNAIWLYAGGWFAVLAMMLYSKSLNSWLALPSARLLALVMGRPLAWWHPSSLSLAKSLL